MYHWYNSLPFSFKVSYKLMRLVLISCFSFFLLLDVEDVAKFTLLYINYSFPKVGGHIQVALLPTPLSLPTQIPHSSSLTQ